MDADARADAIEIVVPARTEYASTLRVLVASLGADLGFTVDEIDDLRLAVTEVFASAAEEGDGSRVAYSFRVAGSAIEVTARREDGAAIVLDALAASILRSIVDVAEAVPAAIRFSKRAVEATR